MKKVKKAEHIQDPELEEFYRNAEAGEQKLKKAMTETVWDVVDRAISVLVKKEDIIETTARYCIVGYLIDQLEHADLLREQAFQPYKQAKRRTSNKLSNKDN